VTIPFLLTLFCCLPYCALFALGLRQSISNLEANPFRSQFFSDCALASAEQSDGRNAQEGAAPKGVLVNAGEQCPIAPQVATAGKDRQLSSTQANAMHVGGLSESPQLGRGAAQIKGSWVAPFFL
jgi:hypothetical protein